MMHTEVVDSLINGLSPEELGTLINRLNELGVGFGRDENDMTRLVNKRTENIIRMRQCDYFTVKYEDGATRVVVPEDSYATSLDQACVLEWFADGYLLIVNGVPMAHNDVDEAVKALSDLK